MGIKEDLSLESDQYQWLGSLFYFGIVSPRSPRATALTGLHRIPRLGIPNQSSFAAPPTWQILCGMYPHLGSDSMLLCRCEQLPGRHRHPLHAGCL